MRYAREGLLIVGIAGFWILAAKEEREAYLKWVYAAAGVGAWLLGVRLAGGALGGILGQAVLVALFIWRKARKDRARTKG